MKTFAFIDASNLFYGGEKSLGWKIDYQKLLKYLQDKCSVGKVFYFGGVEIHDFEYNYQANETVPIQQLEKHLLVKLYDQEDGMTKRKANCDVDMAFHLMKEKDNFDRVIVLSGDGDFLPVLKYLRSQRKQVVLLGRGERTAKEIRQFAGSEFRDFEYLRERLRMQ